MTKGNPRLGQCLCGEEATIRNTKAEDGRLHFTCHALTSVGRPKHWGFVDRSARDDIINALGFEDWVFDEEITE